MQAGMVVAKCKFWDRIPNQDGMKEGDWFEKPEFDIAKRVIPEQRIVWLRDVLVAAIDYQNPGDNGLQAPSNVFFRKYNQALAANKILISKATIEGIILKERHQHDKNDTIQLVHILKDGEALPTKRRVADDKEEDNDEHLKKKIKLGSLLNKEPFHNGNK